LSCDCGRPQGGQRQYRPALHHRHHQDGDGKSGLYISGFWSQDLLLWVLFGSSDAVGFGVKVFPIIGERFPCYVGFPARRASNPPSIPFVARTESTFLTYMLMCFETIQSCS
jgi:hypothetical protein